MALIDNLAQAIATMEGFNVSGSVAQRNNNPGNLTASPYATGNVNGYSVFPSADVGWQALDYQLQLYANRGLTLEQMVNIYAPSGNTPMTQGNDPNNYLNFLTSQLGVGPSTSISALYDSTAATTVSTDVSTSDTTDPSSSLLDSFSNGISDLFAGNGTDGGTTVMGIGLGLLGVGIVVWLTNR
jgi:hypothetical protein